MDELFDRLQREEWLVARARDRLLAIAARIQDPRWRDSFLRNVRENARTLELARAWLGDQGA